MSNQEIDLYKWQIAEVLANRRALFVLWAIKTLFCTTKADFLHHYKITSEELNSLLDRLTTQGFLQQDAENYVLTAMGEETVARLGKLDISQFAHPERVNSEVLTRFTQGKTQRDTIRVDTPEGTAGIENNFNIYFFVSRITGNIMGDDNKLQDLITGSRINSIRTRFWANREHDRDKPEANLVELPCIQQLAALGWRYQPGDIGVAKVTGRSSFHEVLLEEHLRAVLPRINRHEASGEIWLDEARVDQAIDNLKRIFTSYSPSLIQTNETATELLQAGTRIQGTPELHNGQMQPVRYIDFAHPYNNRFLVINQFRVDLANNHYIVPDIVLFVNGIPLVVIECKNPALTNPVEEAVTQLLRYTRQHVASASADQEPDEAAPELFYFNQLLISTCFFQARFAALGASYEHFHEWKTPYPLTEHELAEDLGTKQVSSQQMLLQGMLDPQNLLDLLYNFTLFRTVNGKKIKLVARYHQFRAVQEAIKRLTTKSTRQQHGEDDQRGGIIWHTQGSGKSLTMMFLVRKMRTVSKLREFKVIFVTDRKDLEQQLRETAYLTQETPQTAHAIRELEPLLKPEGANLIFAMIQKYQRRKNAGYRVEDIADEDDANDEDEATDQDDEADAGIDNVNTQENILVIVDEAHRSQARKLHANLKKMLPNCARIAFTGTPIIRGRKKKTHEIFGSFIDEYTIKQSELDGATLPIFYEGREAYIEITERELLDDKHEDIVRPLPRQIRESLREKYETYREVLEAPQLIEVKAWDIMLNYAVNILPNGFKAMVVAVSRLGAVRYCAALKAAQKKLLEHLDALPAEQRDLPEEQLKHLDANDELTRLIRIFPLRDTIQKLEFAAVVSPGKDDLKDTRVDWGRWTDEKRNEHNIDEFKKPLHHPEPGESSPLAFLCVRSMLITGFDAPIVQALYLDRSIKNHELLQAIARVNRVNTDKTSGIVVDYFGVAQNLKEALQAYSEHDVQGALVNIKDEIPLLADRHRRVMAIFAVAQCPINDVPKCVNLLKDLKIRADFEIKLKKFMESMDIVLPREYALQYIDDAQQLGVINRSAATTYRDDQLNLSNVGNKVRKLIDEHIDALHIRQLIEPISIQDANFERKLKRHQSDETNAAEMESFARAYIDYNFAQEDPVYYTKLSERLDAIVKALHANWSQRVADLEAFIHLITQPRTIDKTNLDPRTERPFLGILEEEVRKGSYRFAIPPNKGTGRPLEDSELFQLADLTRHIVQAIRWELAGNDDFWLIPENQEYLRRRIGRMLEEEGQRLLNPFTRREAVALRLINLARALTPRLRDA